VPRGRAGLRGRRRHAGLSLHRGLDVVRWFLHGDQHSDHHRRSNPSPVTRRARVQHHHHHHRSRAGVSGHRLPHPGFARIRAAELLWKAPHGARHRPSHRSLHHLRRRTRRPQYRPRTGAPSRSVRDRRTERGQGAKILGRELAHARRRRHPGTDPARRPDRARRRPGRRRHHRRHQPLYRADRPQSESQPPHHRPRQRSDGGQAPAERGCRFRRLSLCFCRTADRPFLLASARGQFSGCRHYPSRHGPGDWRNSNHSAQSVCRQDHREIAHPPGPRRLRPRHQARGRHALQPRARRSHRSRRFSDRHGRAATTSRTRTDGRVRTLWVAIIRVASMKIVSAAEMREIDRVTSERFGVPSLTLMENAGSAVARFVLSDYPQAERVGILCGKGNNGGDGFVVARKLVEAGRAVRVLLLSDPEELRGDAAIMFQHVVESLHPVNVAPLIVREASGLDSSDAAEVFAADVIVDAILGTGFRPPVSPLYAAAIARMKMNASAAPIVAVDIPSGADADAMQPPTAPGSGDVISNQARADAIVTFTAPRPAHVFAALTGGPTVIAPIGSPPEAIVSQLGLHLSTPSDFAPLLAPRARIANKGSYGHVLVIGGSLGKAGAAAMAGFAALRAGTGLSTVATPKSVLATVAAFHPELMTEPLAETKHGTISLQAVGLGLDALLERKTLAIGPGISRDSETAEFVRTVVTRGDKSVVIDADGLNAFEGAADKLNGP